MGKKKSKKIDWINHFINFFGVVLGILIAFWLNSWYQDRNEQRIVNIALQNIRSELIRNSQKIDSIILGNEFQTEFIEKYLSVVDQNMNLKITKQEVDEMVRKYPANLNEGGKGLSISLDLFQLSSVAWETAQGTGILPSIDFSLAYQLAELYNTQRKLDDFDTNIINDLKEIGDSKDSFKRVLLSSKTAINFATDLRDKFYPVSIEAIETELNGGRVNTTFREP